MANGIKIGGLSFDALKIGSSDVDAAYIGDTLVYSGSTPPTPTLQWVTFTNEYPSQEQLFQIYGIRFNSHELDSSGNEINIFNEDSGNNAYFIAAGRGKCDFYSWSGCEWQSSSSEDIELDLTNGYEDECGDETQPPYYLDIPASQALESITYQLLIYQ